MSTTIIPGQGGPLWNYAPPNLTAPWDDGYTYRARVEVGALIGPNQVYAPDPRSVATRPSTRSGSALLPAGERPLAGAPPLVGHPPGTELERQWLALVKSDGRQAVRAMVAEATAIADRVQPVGIGQSAEMNAAESVGDRISDDLAAQDAVTAAAKARTLLLRASALSLIDTRVQGGVEQAALMADVIGRLAVAATGIARATTPPTDILLELTFNDLDKLRQVISAIGPLKRSLTARIMTAFSFGKEAALSPSSLGQTAQRLVTYITAYSLIKTR